MIERENPTSTRETSEVEISEEMSDIFAQIDPAHVEQFYKHYQIWSKQRRLALAQIQVSALQEAINDNTELLQQTHPSAIALAALSQLQSCGVDDIDLLDRMFARGDVWLDQTMELLGQCERMGFIQDGYTLWCENALDGAFDWLVSMNEATATDTARISSSPEAVSTPSESFKEVTEDLLLQKLMSEDEEETKKRPAITLPLETIGTEKDFFSSLPVVPLPMQEKDFFSSLPVVPLPRPRIEEPEIEDYDGISAPAEMIVEDVISLSQDEPSQELFLIASLHATPLPAQTSETMVTAVPSIESSTAPDALSTPEQEVVTPTSDDEVVTIDIESLDEDSGITASIPHVSIGARTPLERQEDHRIEVMEKMPAAQVVPVVAASNDEDEAVHSDTAAWKWKELKQHETSVAQTDVLAHKQQETYIVAPKPRRKIGFFRRLLNWLLGRTPDY